jgi:hypothetical protein
MKTITLAMLMSSFICLLPSCKHNCSGVSIYYLHANLLKPYSFEPGSYWVYRDSASGIIDSQVVYDYYTRDRVVVGQGPVGDGSWCDDYADGFGMSIGSFWDSHFHDTIFYGNAVIYSSLSTSVIKVRYSTFPLYTNIYSYNVFTNTPTLTNYTVSSHTFPRVHLFTSDFNSQMYHVDSIGVVRWVFNDTVNGQRTWDLLRYHVITPP